MKNKIPRFYVILILISLSIFFLVEWFMPRKVSWDTTLSPKDKMPYGTYVVKELLPQLFPEKNFTTNKHSYFELQDEMHNSNLIIISNNFNTDEYSINALLNMAENGNNIFISALDWDYKFLDTLNLTLKYSWNGSNNNFNFLDENLKSDKPYFFEYKYYSYFDTDSCTKFTPLSYVEYNTRYNFIKIEYGEGNFYLNAVPLAFTNYTILKSLTRDYVEKSFSLLDQNDIVWDDYVRKSPFPNMSVFQLIKQHPPLKAAYYFSILFIILFVIFYGKRRQRVIPVIKPLRNNSLDFISTISRLYFQQKKHEEIASKRLHYFLHDINLKYKIKAKTFDDDLVEKLSLRTKKSKEKISSIINNLRKYHNMDKISSTDLIELNKQIEKFYE